MEAVAAKRVTLRPLAKGDLDALVDIDAKAEGRPRRGYFQRRLEAALREPALHAQFAATDEKGVAGYILARVLVGEFGRAEPSLRLEIVGVRDDARGSGVGTALLDALTAWGGRHGIRELRLSARWNDHPMLRWLDASGFVLAPNHVVERDVAGRDAGPDDPLTVPEGFGPGHEIDYGEPAGNDFERLGRGTADVRPMTPRDLADIVRIDRDITGRDRGAYIGGKLDEAMVDSGIRVSLTARMDGAIVGFLMARADLGDFGRIDPTAVLDTIGVDPEYAHRGVGHALVAELFANLHALHIERVETVVAPKDLALLSFLYDCGFAPSQRIAFLRTDAKRAA